MRGSVPDAGVDHHVEQIDDQVHDDVGGGEDQQHALNDRIVAVQNCVDDKPADPRNGEDAFGHHDAPEQQRDADADDRHDRNGGVRQGMGRTGAATPEAPWRAPS